MPSRVDAHTGALVEARRLRVGYRGRAVLPPVDLRVGRGQFWFVMGRNGAGKSTLLKTLLGLLAPVAGTVKLAPGTRVAWIAQRLELDTDLPLRARDVVAGGATSRRDVLWPWRRARVRRAACKALAAMGVEALAAQRLDQLSEGQKQRVLLARAMASRPHLLVADEPTSAMDAAGERAAFELLEGYRQRDGLTVLAVSHQLEVARAMATHVLFVDRDDELVLAGTRDAVMGHEAFRRHYLWQPSPQEEVRA